jgi:hypothetical protein
MVAQYSLIVQSSPLPPPSRRRMKRPEARRGWIIAAAFLAFGSVGCAEQVQAARQTASGEEPLAAATFFVVRFAPDHPLGRAQTLEALAVRPDAEATARSAIAIAPELQGLCFERFTLGGEGVVLSVCDATPIEQTGQVLWLERLVAMTGVERAEPNAIVVY